MTQQTANKTATYAAIVAVCISVATLVYAAGGDRTEVTSRLKALEIAGHDREARLRMTQDAIQNIGILTTKIDTMNGEVVRLRDALEGRRLNP